MIEYFQCVCMFKVDGGYHYNFHIQWLDDQVINKWNKDTLEMYALIINFNYHGVKIARTQWNMRGIFVFDT